MAARSLLRELFLVVDLVNRDSWFVEVCDDNGMQ
jgi:hypothetical protein